MIRNKQKTQNKTRNKQLNKKGNKNSKTFKNILWKPAENKQNLSHRGMQITVQLEKKQRRGILITTGAQTSLNEISSH